MTQNNIQAGLLFFRTSSAARSAPRFLRETAMLPPLAYSVCVDTLLHLSSGAPQKRLHLHFADQEGDPFAVALAGRLGAYVAGRDSDFVVLNAEGYQGYVPLDEMVWTVTSRLPLDLDLDGSVYSASVAGDTEDGEPDEDGFQTVKKSKGRKKQKAGQLQGQATVAGRGILPPSALPSPTESADEQQLSLSFAVYSPSVLATHLNIPVSLLPLLGALLGNDFTATPSSDGSGPPPATTAEIRSRGRHQNLERLFFERQLTLSQRITRVASTLANILSAAFGNGAASAKKRGRKQIGSVMDLIDAAVTALLVRPADTFATGEREAVVERIAEATLQYAIPKAEDGAEGEGLRWASDVCALHTPEACPLLVNLSRRVNERVAELEAQSDTEGADPETLAEDDPLAKIRDSYVTAYRGGVLDPHILDCVQTGTMWPRRFLEDPDKECVLRSVGRPIRLWTYAALDEGIGLPSAVDPDADEEGDEDEEDEDELIDVVEEDEDEDESGDEDPLARLRGALKELDGSEAQHPPANGAKGAPGEAEAATASSAQANVRLKTVTEYVRRGTRLAPEEVTVRPLGGLLAEISLEAPRDPSTGVRLPPQVWPDALRRTLLLRALGADVPSVAALPDEHLMAALTVRWVVQRMDTRARESGGAKERMAERWTQAEARAVLACLSVDEDAELSAADEGAREPVGERHVQLVAQVSAALDAIEQFAQVLLLASTVRSPGKRFSGVRCHGLLSGRIALSAGEPGEDVWAACIEGLDEAYALPPQRRAKDKKGKTEAGSVGKGVKPGKGNAARGGMFGLLADVEA